MVWHHFYVSQNTVSNAHLHDKIYIFVKKKNQENCKHKFQDREEAREQWEVHREIQK